MFHKTSEIFEFNKMLFIYAITLLVIVFWLIRITIAGSIILKKTPFDIFILLFLLSQAVSTLFSIDRHTSIFGYYGRFNGGLLSIISYIVLYYGFVTHLSGSQFRRDVLRLLKISVIASCVVVVWAIPGIFGYDLSCLVFTGKLYNGCWTQNFRPAQRIFSTLGQPNWLGAYLAANFFLGLYFFIVDKTNIVLRRYKFNVQKIWGIYLIISGTGLFFTHSRSSFIALFIGIILFFALFVYKAMLRQKRHVKHAFKPLIFPVIIVILLGLLVIFSGGVRFNPKPTAEQITDSFTIRTIVWKGAMQLGLKYPFFGTGPETFGYSYYFVRPKEHNLTSEWDFLYNKAHNEFLNYFATTGFFGAGAYLLLILAVYRYGITSYLFQKKNAYLFLVLLSAFSTLHVTNFFGFSTSTIQLLFYLIIAFLLVDSDYTAKAPMSEVVNLDRKIYNLRFFISGLVVAIIGAVFLITYFVADVMYARALSSQDAQRYDRAFVYMQTAYRFRPEHVYADKLATLAAQSAVLAVYTPDNKQMTAELYDISRAYTNKAISQSPKNVLYLKTEARNNYLFYQITNKESYFKKAVEAMNASYILAPTDPKLPYTHAFFVFSRYKGGIKKSRNRQILEQESLSLVDRALVLKEDYRDAHLLKGQILVKLKKFNDAKREFQYILERINPHDTQAQKELNKL